MPRVKRGTTASKRRKNLLKHAKGFMWGRSHKFRPAKDALTHAWAHQFNDRRKKKGQFRRLWQVQVGAAARMHGVSYNKFINGLKKHDIDIDRKILSDLAQNHEIVFQQLVELSQK
ncbi:MAG: 50S ribosomal protein L20 [Parcubacteria group bacterium]